MLLRVCDMCGARHVDYFKYTNAVRRSDVRLTSPYDTNLPDFDTLTIKKDGRAQFTGEICTDCAKDIEATIVGLINRRKAIKQRPHL